VSLDAQRDRLSLSQTAFDQTHQHHLAAGWESHRASDREKHGPRIPLHYDPMHRSGDRQRYALKVWVWTRSASVCVKRGWLLARRHLAPSTVAQLLQEATRGDKEAAPNERKSYALMSARLSPNCGVW